MRYAKWTQKAIDEPAEVRTFVTRILPKLFPGFAQGKTIAITPEMLKSLSAAGMQMGDKWKPGEHKMPETAARIAENRKTLK